MTEILFIAKAHNDKRWAVLDKDGYIAHVSNTDPRTLKSCRYMSLDGVFHKMQTCPVRNKPINRIAALGYMSVYWFERSDGNTFDDLAHRLDSWIQFWLKDGNKPAEFVVEVEPEFLTIAEQIASQYGVKCKIAYHSQTPDRQKQYFKLRKMRK